MDRKSLLFAMAIMMVFPAFTVSADTNVTSLKTACSAGDLNQMACSAVNAAVSATPTPNGTSISCIWNNPGAEHKCSLRVTLDSSIITGVMLQSSLIKSMEFIQSGSPANSVIFYSDPFVPHYVHVIANGSLFPVSKDPEFWMKVTSIADITPKAFSFDSVDPAQMTAAEKARLKAQYLGQGNITLGEGIAPDLSLIKSFENFTWNLTISYDTGKILAGAAECNGTVSGNSCSGNWSPLPECTNPPNCPSGTYIKGFPSAGLLTVYGADPVPVYGTSGGSTMTLSLCQTINSSGSYILNKSVSSAGTCFTIAADNVVLDGAGYTVNYSQSAVGYGINNSGGYDNITIKNFKIVQGNSSISHAYAIYAGAEMVNSRIINNTITTLGNHVYGIYLHSSNTNTILDNKITTSDGYSIYLYSSNTNTISNNTIINLGDYTNAILLWYSSDLNTLSDNTITTSGNYGFGIRLTSSSNNNFSNNIITTLGANGWGIYPQGSSNSNTFLNNIITTSGSNSIGIRIDSSSNNRITGGSIISAQGYEYDLENTGGTNNFTNTDFTVPRSIYFRDYDTTSWFNYNNETNGNIWLKTSVSAQSNITRKLIKWGNLSMEWNDTNSAGATVAYNITGLLKNAEYNVYNNSKLLYTLFTDSAGSLNFTLRISEESNIVVNRTIFTAISPTIHNINITTNFRFIPQNITINRGEIVNWTNLDINTHRVVDDNMALFDSGNLVQGNSYSFQFNNSGIIPYHCQIHPTMTGNVIISVTTTTTTTTTTSTTSTTIPLQIGNVLINEFQSDPNGTDAGNEWVELYNNGSSEVNLTGWRVETVDLAGILGSHGFRQIIFPTLTLTNTGDIITLKYGNTTADRVVYGNVANETSVVAAPPSGQSAGRIPDGGLNWTIFTTPTPAASNSAGACILKGDKNCNGIVDDFELLEYITRWATANVSDFDLLEAINNWAKG